MKHTDAVVLGLGEIGEPFRTILARRWDVAGLDIDIDPGVDQTDFLHVCYPFDIPDFVGATVDYIERFDPSSVVIHSTVAPGTTEQVQKRVPDVPVFYSPVRGKHSAMEEHMLSYRKFVAGPDQDFDSVRKHLEEAGLVVDRMQNPKALELAKLLETTYFGVLIAWAQEADRFARSVGSDHETVKRFVEEVPFLPSEYFPGFIGGHCVMPNIEILRSLRSSQLLDFIVDSNAAWEGADHD